MLADAAPGLTPYRYCFNNPVNYTDPYGLWEQISGGYTTNLQSDIGRFYDYLTVENKVLNNAPTFSQMSSFISGEMKTGGLGTLSDGSKLAKGFEINNQKDFFGVNHYVTDKASFNDFWYGVQGDLTPSALDPRTLGHNLFYTSYAGSNNPRKYNGEDDYSYNPSNEIEQAARWHDLRYRDMGISGFNGLFNDPRSIKADYTYVNRNLASAYNPLLSPVDRARGFFLGIGLGVLALPKTMEYIRNYIPKSVNSN